jgi:hypothetical protein
MELDDLIARLGQRYAGGPSRTARVRHRTSALDAYLAELQQYTLQRLDADSPTEFTLQRLTDLINGKAERPFCLTAVRKALVAHGLYDLWR